MTTKIIVGDCLDVLPTLEAESVQACITSPPYWRLRDYGVNEQLGLERLHDCLGWATGDPCGECYVCHTVAWAREVRRVLKDDGTLWVVIGDSYASGKGKCYNPGGGENSLGQNRKAAGAHPLDRGNKSELEASGLKPKDLVGIPWRLALALQADGWYLRSDVIWAKPNPMPESVRDRPTRAHEYVFLLAKSQRYYWNQAAVKEPAVIDHDSGNGYKREEQFSYRDDNGPHENDKPWKAKRKARDSFKRNGSKREQAMFGQSMGTHRPNRKESEWDIQTRNIRTIWTAATHPFPEAHFATYPPALVEIMIKASTKEGDTVLDPFGGAGTTALVASRLSRNSVLIELNPEYATMAERRIRDDAPMLVNVTLEGI